MLKKLHRLTCIFGIFSLVEVGPFVLIVKNGLSVIKVTLLNVAVATWVGMVSVPRVTEGCFGYKSESVPTDRVDRNIARSQISECSFAFSMETDSWNVVEFKSSVASVAMLVRVMGVNIFVSSILICAVFQFAQCLLSEYLLILVKMVRRITC